MMSFEESLIEHCSPTLAGLKSGSLYRFFPENPRQFALQLRQWREWFQKRGLHLLVVKFFRPENACLLYLYRPRLLSRELAQPDVSRFLTDLGYHTGGGTESLLCQLVARLCLQSGFPNEIGLFLGYPLEDVRGFIVNKGKNYTCCGCWKSYGDPIAARRRFSSYRACTAAYKTRYAHGANVLQLTAVA